MRLPAPGACWNGAGDTCAPRAARSVASWSESPTRPKWSRTSRARASGDRSRSCFVGWPARAGTSLRRNCWSTRSVHARSRCFAAWFRSPARASRSAMCGGLTGALAWLAALGAAYVAQLWPPCTRVLGLTCCMPACAQVREMVTEGDATAQHETRVTSKRLLRRRAAIQSGEEEIIRVIPSVAWGATPYVVLTRWVEWVDPHVCGAGTATAPNAAPGPTPRWQCPRCGHQPRHLRVATTCRSVAWLVVSAPGSTWTPIEWELR